MGSRRVSKASKIEFEDRERAELDRRYALVRHVIEEIVSDVFCLQWALVSPQSFLSHFKTIAPMGGWQAALEKHFSVSLDGLPDDRMITIAEHIHKNRPASPSMDDNDWLEQS